MLLTPRFFTDIILNTHKKIGKVAPVGRRGE